MPKIPQFEATARLEPTNMAEEAANKEAFHEERTAEIAPRLYEQGARELQGGINQMDEHQAQAQTASMLNDISDLTVQAHQQLNTTLNGYDPSSGTDVMQGFTDDLDKRLDAIGDKYDNPKTQEAFARMRAETRTNLLDRGYTQQQDIVRTYTAQQLGSSGQKMANAAATDPASVDIIAGQYKSSIQTMADQHPGMFSADERDKLTRSGVEDIYNSAGMQIVHQINSNPNASLRDIAAARQLLAGDNFKNNMSPTDYNKVLDDLDKAGETRQDAATIYIDKSTPQILDSVRQNGDPDGRWGRLLGSTAVHTPEQLAAAQVRLDQYNAAIADHKVGQDINNMPENQVQQYIQARKADWASANSGGDPAAVTAAHGAYDAAVRMAKERDEEFNKSPATYMLNHNDTVGALYAKYQQNPTPQSFQVYAAFSAGQQQKLYPGQPVEVLTNDMKQDVKSKMAAVDQTPQGALAAAATLNQLHDLTGQYYTGAIHELMKDKIIRPDQYVAGTLIARPESQMLAQEVLQAAAVPKDAMDKTSPLAEDRAVAVARAAFLPLAQTMKGTVNGDDLLNAYISSTAQVLRQRAVSGGPQYLGSKMSGQVAQDATQIANQMVLGRIQVKGGMRIPTNYDAGDVVGGATSVQGDLANHDLVLAPSYGGLINGKQQYAKDIASDGYWVTNPKGDGAVLYFQGAPVHEKGPKGTTQTISLNFDQMQKLGKSSRSPLNEIGRFFTNSL